MRHLPGDVRGAGVGGKTLLKESKGGVGFGELEPRNVLWLMIEPFSNCPSFVSFKGSGFGQWRPHIDHSHASVGLEGKARDFRRDQVKTASRIFEVRT